MWWWWWCANFCVFSPCERSVCDNSNKDKHGGDSVRLVEELQADVVHRPLVDRFVMVGGIRALCVESFPSCHLQLFQHIKKEEGLCTLVSA